ncbi:MAG: hypothetical protein C3L25_13745 [Candidatus Sedimenticola endophacoides]|nr:MAG: hypothetical protein C3L26_13840 [Candidatus Sedimenticola endophacoides]PUE00430.1 MAG: hypothetical protein C3L25_13745 [Candidatus Sedimenticola endophacoides]
MHQPLKPGRLLPLLLLLLCLPPSPGQATDWNYRIQPGDTIWDLSHELLDDWRRWKAVAQHNGVEDGRQVRTGRIIQIPEEWLNQQPISVVLNAVSGEVIVVTARDGRRIPAKAGIKSVATS